MALSREDFRQQAQFRYHLRRFLCACEANARKAGLDPSQYQLLLCIKGMPDDFKPNITTLSERLLIETHSTVELVDRCVNKGLVERFREGPDRRNVFVRLTEEGSSLVEKIAQQNRREMQSSVPAFIEFLEVLQNERRSIRDNADAAAHAQP